MATDFRIKRIYEPPAAEDGMRILVDRIWPRGVSKKAAALDLWLKDVAPSPSLRKWFGHDPERFEEFSLRYRMELGANGTTVDRLRQYLKEGRATLLYAAHDPVHNHAVVLADYLRQRAESRHAARLA
jgi:uncharacterized protein YeaO (DUF488 family)